jgi:hypothetical protein
MADLLEGLLTGRYYQAGAANTLVPQQVGLQRSEMNNQQSFYDAQDTLARSDPFKSNPFLQMMTYQLSPKMSPSDASLRGLAYGQSPGATQQGLADQFKPTSMFNMTPSNIMGSIYQEMSQDPQFASLPEADKKVLAMQKFYDQGGRMPSYDPSTQERFQYQQNPQPAPQQPWQPPQLNQPPVQPQQQPLPPIQQRRMEAQQPQGQPTSIEGLTTSGSDMPVDDSMVLAETPITREWNPKAKADEIAAFGKEDIKNRKDERATLSRLEKNIPLADNVLKDLVEGKTQTGTVEGLKNILGTSIMDIFGMEALTPDQIEGLTNQQVLERFGSEQSLQNAITFLNGQGSVSDAERALIGRLSTSLNSGELRNAFNTSLAKISMQDEAEKTKAYRKYVNAAGSDILPALGANNFDEYYQANYANKPPVLARISSEIGKNIKGVKELNATQQNMVRNAAVDLRGVDKSDPLVNGTLATEGALFIGNKGYGQIVNGKPVMIKGLQ